MNKLCDTPTQKPKYSLEIGGKTYADPKAARSLLALMNMHAVIGGAACHWGGPSALLEILSVIHQTMFTHNKWHQKFNLVNDIGHAENALYTFKALYAYGDLSFNDLKGFRSFGSRLTGHGESHLYPEGVLMSNGPLGSSLAQAQGLAMSDKLLGNDRVTISLLSDGGAMEGEAKEALAAIPGLAKKGQLNPYLLIISDNDTKLSGRMGDAFSMKPTIASLEALGWKIVSEEKGNDLEACIKSFDTALTQAKTQPTVLVLKTLKGKGIKATEESASGGHGFPLKAYSADITAFIDEIWENNAPEEFKTWASSLTIKPEVKTSNNTPKEKMQVGVSKALIELREAGLPIVSLSSDLQGSTGLKPFHQKFPQFSFDLGIAESNMVGAAAGFSKNGFIPVVDTFAAFGVTKGNLPLIMASLSQSPIICVFSHAGFQDAADGASHQSLTYFSALASIPGVELISTANSSDAYEMIKLAAKKQFDEKESGHAKSYVFFLGRETFPSKFNDSYVPELNDELINQGKDVLLVASGAVVHEAVDAAKKLSSQGVSAGVINHKMLSSIDLNFYKKLLASHGDKLVTIEDHQVKAGIGSHLNHQLINEGIDFKSLSLGVSGEFGQSAYTAKEIYAKHKIDANSIADQVKSWL